jgi:hypothetical protein
VSVCGQVCECASVCVCVVRCVRVCGQVCECVWSGVCVCGQVSHISAQVTLTLNGQLTLYVCD